MTSKEELLKTIRRWIGFFIIVLVLSGVTAFGLETELGWLLKHWPGGGGDHAGLVGGGGGLRAGVGGGHQAGIGGGLQAGIGGGGLRGWVQEVYGALRETNVRWPYLAYGYDWLAFAHLVIAVAFVGPLLDPVRNKWVILFGMIACVMVFPLAFIAGGIRGIPVYWRLIDCSFGVVGLVPLGVCYRKIGVLEREGCSAGR